MSPTSCVPRPNRYVPSNPTNRISLNPRERRATLPMNPPRHRRKPETHCCVSPNCSSPTNISCRNRTRLTQANRRTPSTRPCVPKANVSLLPAAKTSPRCKRAPAPWASVTPAPTGVVWSVRFRTSPRRRHSSARGSTHGLSVSSWRMRTSTASAVRKVLPVWSRSRVRN